MAVNPEPRPVHSKRLHPRDTVVGRAVIHHNDFERQHVCRIAAIASVDIMCA
jgi:hypothetical protein